MTDLNQLYENLSQQAKALKQYCHKPDCCTENSCPKICDCRNSMLGLDTAIAWTAANALYDFCSGSSTKIVLSVIGTCQDIVTLHEQDFLHLCVLLASARLTLIYIKAEEENQ